MGEKKIQILFGFIIVVSAVSLLFAIYIGANKLKQTAMENYKTSQIETISELTKETEEKQKEYVKVLEEIEKHTISEESKKIIEEENKIALDLKPIAPNIILSISGEPVLYVFDRVADINGDDRYIIAQESAGSVYNPVTQDFSDVYLASNVEPSEAFYVYNNKVYVYKLGNQERLLTKEGYEEIDKENKDFQEKVLEKNNISNEDEDVIIEIDTTIIPDENEE